MRIAKAFTAVALLGLLSSLLGYVRDAVLGARFGASSLTDAYFAASFVPNTLYLILISGTLSAVFIPIFTQYLERDRQAAWYVASCTINGAAVAVGAIVVIGSLTADLWMPLLFPGFAAGTQETSIELSYALLPILLFATLYSLFAAELNALRHFTCPALAPVICNLVAIAAIVCSGRLGIRAVALGALAGMAAQMAAQVPPLMRGGARYHLSLGLRHPATQQLLRLGLPLLAYLAVAYASVFAERTIASTLGEGTVSAFNYALRVFNLPIGIFVASLVTVIYPQLSLQAARHDLEGLAGTLLQVVSSGALVLAPVSLWTVINSQWIVRILYGHGRFDAQSLALTGQVLQAYAIGMVPAGVNILLQRGFYARQEMVVPLAIEVGNLPLYLCMASVLAGFDGAHGLATARALSFAALTVVYLVVLGSRQRLPSWPRAVLSLLVRLLGACVAPGVAWSIPVWGSRLGLRVPASAQGDVAAVLLFGTLGIGLYLAALLLLHRDSDLVGTALRLVRQRKVGQRSLGSGLANPR